MATKKVVKKSTTKAAVKSAPKKATAVKKTTPKSPKKAPAKTTVKATTLTVKPEVQKQPETTPQQTVKMRKSYVALIIVIILLGAAIYYFRSLFVAAVVNGQPISRIEVIQQTEKQSGKQTLDTLVRDALIEQEAKKENISVSDKEVNDQIVKLQNNLKKQGQTLDQVLAAQGMTQDDVRHLFRLNILVQKLVGKDVKVSNQEINDYIAKNKDTLPQSDEATIKNQVKAQLTQQKTNEAVQAWLAQLQQKANIVYFVQY